MLRRAFRKLERAGKFDLYFRTVLLLYLDREERIDAEQDSPECVYARQLVAMPVTTTMR